MRLLLAVSIGLWAGSLRADEQLAEAFARGRSPEMQRAMKHFNPAEDAIRADLRAGAIDRRQAAAQLRALKQPPGSAVADPSLQQRRRVARARARWAAVAGLDAQGQAVAQGSVAAAAANQRALFQSSSHY